MDDVALRATFDEQVRRRTQADEPGACIETDGATVRQVARDGHGWSGITWSELADPAEADRAIAAQVRYFALGGRSSGSSTTTIGPRTWAPGSWRPGSCPMMRRP